MGTTTVGLAELRYETRKWGKPAKLQVSELGLSGDIVITEARLLCAAGTPCLDARNPVRFEIAGDGALIGDLGTSRSARVVELSNGRAVIRIMRNRGKSQASISNQDIRSAFFEIARAQGCLRWSAIAGECTGQ